MADSSDDSGGGGDGGGRDGGNESIWGSGFLSDASWTADIHDDSRSIYAPRPKPQWNFLEKGFKSVARRCAISDDECVDSHPVRIGREMDDLWIDVRVEDGSTSGQMGLARFRREPVDPAWRAEKLRTAREGLLLLSTLARVDYQSWVGGMVRKAYFPVPTHLELQHCPDIERAFCFFLNSYLGPQYYQWELLQHMMGVDDLSEAFTTDMAKIQEIATREGRDANLFEVIPIKLAIEPEGTDGERIERELSILRGVTKSVRELLAINAQNNNTNPSADTPRTRPYFRFDSIELNLRSFTQHPDVFDAIRELLETGVHVKSLILPKNRFQGDVHETKLRRAWADVVVTALGHRLLGSGRAAQVDRLDLPGSYMSEEFMVPLCSALHDTSVLKRLSIDFEGFDELETAPQRRLWHWLDYALFSPIPSNSVETLALSSIKLRSTAHGELATGRSSGDPIGDLWSRVADPRNSVDVEVPVGGRPTVRIAAGTTVSRDGLVELETTAAYTGVLINDTATKATVDVLVPGLGFCQIPREKIVPVDQSATLLDDAKTITTLKVDLDHSIREEGRSEAHVMLMRTFIERLLRFVGPSLTSLSLGCALLDAADVQLVSRLCPHLHSLCVRGVTMDSMDALTTLYEAPVNCQISSLDLSHLHVPIEAFEHFLGVLTPEDGFHPIQKTLQRLRVGRGYSGTFRRATRTAITHMLHHNTKLTHFLLFEKSRRDRADRHGRWLGDDDSEDDDDDMGDEADEQDEDDRNWKLSDFCYNGELLTEYPLIADRQRGFLSIVRELGHENRAGGRLGTDLIRHIFSFAADRMWRRAFTLRDVDSEMLDFLQQRMPHLLR